jgi:hypothetical protein
MRNALLSFLTAGLLVGSLQAQTPCANLDVHVSQGQQQTVVFNVQGDPNAFVGLVLGTQAGSTTVPLGALGTLQLGVASPFDVQWIGNTDSRGNLTEVVHVPANVPATDLVAQAFTVPVSNVTNPPLHFCTSNVVPFRVGT